MTGGDSKILTEKAAPACPSDETVLWSESESREAEELVFELTKYAEQKITFSVDEQDIKDSVSYSFYKKDLDSLRVYKKAILDGIDIFMVDKCIFMLRKYGYAPAANYFTKGTVNIEDKVRSALIDSYNADDASPYNGEADRVCAYAMAHPDLAGKLWRIIAEQRVTSYGRLVAMVDGSIAPAIVEGVL